MSDNPYPITPNPTIAAALDEAKARLAQGRFDLNLAVIRKAKKDIRELNRQAKLVYL